MDLDDFVRRCEEARQVFVTGDPGPAMLLFSHRDDVTRRTVLGDADPIVVPRPPDAALG
jgi:hypothetical protein